MSSHQVPTVEQIIIDNIHTGRTLTLRALKRAGYYHMNLANLKARCDAMRREGLTLPTAVSRPWTAGEDAILLANPNPQAAHDALAIAGFDRTVKAVAQRIRDKKKGGTMTEQALRTVALIATIAVTGCTDDNVFHHVDANERVNFYYECIDRQKAFVGGSQDCANASWDRALQAAKTRMEARK